MTRRLIARLFTSVDGVVSAPNTFQFDSFDDDLARIVGGSIAQVDDVILGRVMYQQWAGYWPAAGLADPFADFINPVAKHVASRTLTPSDITWANAELIEGDLESFVRALKQTDGRDISIEGSISVVRQLFLAGLVDTLTLIVHPVIAGPGERLFGGDVTTTRLRLIGHEVTSSGNAVMTYALRAGESG
jgi:dihydrofolate reductase